MGERDRTRARRLRRFLLLGAAVAPAAFAACDGDTCERGICVDDSGMRLIDRVCEAPLPEGPACEVAGDAARTTGVTDDSTGFRLGEGAGSLSIHLAALDAATRSTGTFSIEVLAAASEQGTTPRLETTLTWGSCAQPCPPDPFPYVVEVDDEYQWVRVVADQAVASGTVPYDAVLTLSGAGIDVADLRSVSVYDEYGCSIAGPVGSRR